jgi:hypothetical protein
VVIAETWSDTPATGPFHYVSGPMVPGRGESNDGHGHVFFNALRQAQRPGLALVNGVVYVAWASHCDNKPYHGWVIGFDANTLKQVSVFNTTPNANSTECSALAGGGIWQAGDGIAADAEGALYFATGNGVFDTTFSANGFPNQGDFGDSVLKLVADPGSSETSPNENGWGLKAADFFTPYEQANMEGGDQDLGSGGVLLVPDQRTAPAHLLVQAGKEGNVYLLVRDNLGKFNANNMNNNPPVQSLNGAIGGAWSMAAYFNETIYYNGGGDVLKAFRLANGQLSPSPVAKASKQFGWPGATPSISSSATSGEDANGIVWTLETDAGDSGPTILHAYRADNLKELYNSTMAAGGRDQPVRTAVKFTVPTVVDGKVYVGTHGGLTVYGNLFQVRSAPPPPPLRPAAPKSH